MPIRFHIPGREHKHDAGGVPSGRSAIHMDSVQVDCDMKMYSAMGICELGMCWSTQVTTLTKSTVRMVD